ncbi:MAG: calcium-binding protein [Methyloceanibacter sp.]|nr:calcium-binding protein [Methyloceanibacter sp.]
MAVKNEKRTWDEGGHRHVKHVGHPTNAHEDHWQLRIFASDEEDNVRISAVPRETVGEGTSDLLKLVYIHLGGGDDTVVGEVKAGWAGDNYDEFIDGGDGTDTITASRMGGFGDGATVYGGSDDDNITGSEKSDLIYGDSTTSNDRGQDEPWENTGTLETFDDTKNYDDTIRGGDGNDEIHGEYGDDRLYGGADDDEIHGGDGNDIILGGSGSDRLYGGNGNDFIDAGRRDGSSIDEITTGDGRDFVNLGHIVGSYTSDGEPVGFDDEELIDDIATAVSADVAKLMVKSTIEGTLETTFFGAVAATGVKTTLNILKALKDQNPPRVTLTEEDYVTITDFNIRDDRALYTTVPTDSFTLGKAVFDKDDNTNILVLEADQNSENSGGIIAKIDYDADFVSHLHTLNKRYSSGTLSEKNLKATMYKTLSESIVTLQRDDDKATTGTPGDPNDPALSGIFINGDNQEVAVLQALESFHSDYDNLYDYYQATLLDGQIAYLIGGGRVVDGSGYGEWDSKNLFGSYDSDIIFAGGPEDLEGSTKNAYLYGFGGNDLLWGSDGDREYLIGGAGQDLLIGGNGTDYFIFDMEKPENVGTDHRDTIADLTIGEDVIRLAHFGTINVSDITFEVIDQDTVSTWGSRDAFDPHGSEAEAAVGDNDASMKDIVMRIPVATGGYQEIVIEDMLSANYTAEDLAFAKRLLLASVERLHGLDDDGDGIWPELLNHGVPTLGDDTIVGSWANNRLYGSSGSDILLGKGGDDELIGGSGTDLLLGGKGDDTLEGDGDGGGTLASPDRLHGEGDNDTYVLHWHFGNTIIEDNGDGWDTVLLKDHHSTGGWNVAIDGDNLILTFDNRPDVEVLVRNALSDSNRDGYLDSLDEDVIETFEFHDQTLTLQDMISRVPGHGTSGPDTLRGTSGDDTLRGYAGNDTLIGGGGDDTFVFSPNFGTDIIADFATGAGSDDVIELRDMGMTSLADVLDIASENYGSTEIEFGDGNKIILSNVSKADLHQDDFSFV